MVESIRQWEDGEGGAVGGSSASAQNDKMLLMRLLDMQQSNSNWPFAPTPPVDTLNSLGKEGTFCSLRHSNFCYIFSVISLFMTKKIPR